MTVAEAVDGLPRRVASWAAAMSLAPNSLTGISLALGVCSAVWFTAGSTLGYAAGALALSSSYLAGRPARQLAGRPGGGTRGWQPGAKAVSDRRLARACAALTECGAYASLAAAGPAAGALAASGLVTGGQVTSGPAAGWSGIWQLATTTVIMVAVSQLAVACASPALAGRPPEASPGGLTWRLLALPYGGRILLVAVTAPVLGARGAFFAVLGGAVVAIGYAIVSGRSRPDAARMERTVACRDDGLIATEIGRPVRGQLVPLPPALTGFAAVSVLALLGLRHLPGLLLLAPVVAMLLAAVGSSHPHDGRLDWIVPVLLQAAQFAYVAAIGAASGVPGPLIFAVCAMIAMHYADLAGHARRGAALGWEGRMIAAGAGAALGIATFAYLLLAAYLGVLICREVMTNWLPATEGDRR